ncbi:hemolysin XhlA family protein [Alkalibacillus salilacus]|uniref:RNase H-like nuclease (RuvC/YqgF family) n=1 Tax=Alkalibacillus salilacus TaxID=284582 RepID=A0ABT9VCV0_9BACI|nr:hemolysin XhlA family protein [Alkalibacillus salilacus]MDQ0158797.1 putative RNase H-like nuclease (RuvC/YqgF family) [Alkalibacillus salilacus]
MSEQHYVTRKEFKQLDNRVGDLENRQTRTETRTDHLENKLDKIESNTTWILRLIIGAILMALLSLVITQGG